ncbi:MAG TPA: hypothetical protein VKZ53_15825 [Candidatus Angelobacter sp.]|nr:hypothetical protein [Candidatus Angelobacter sp.]
MATSQAEVKPEKPYLPANTIEFRGSVGDLEVYFIPTSFNVAPESYDALRLFLERVVAHFTGTLGCNHEGFIQLVRFRPQEVVHRFSDNARKWLPQMGMGVWPDREPPRMWTSKDIENMDPQTGMPTLLYTVFRITAQGNARLDAMHTMAGTSCALQVFSQLETKKLMDYLKEVSLEFIRDRVFRVFPWYVPLLSLTGLKDPVSPVTLRILQNIRLYVRESVEDGGILIVSREPLEDLLPSLGCTFLEGEKVPQWRLTT